MCQQILRFVLKQILLFTSLPIVVVVSRQQQQCFYCNILKQEREKAAFK